MQRAAANHAITLIVTASWQSARAMIATVCAKANTKYLFSPAISLFWQRGTIIEVSVRSPGVAERRRSMAV